MISLPLFPNQSVYQIAHDEVADEKALTRQVEPQVIMRHKTLSYILLSIGKKIGAIWFRKDVCVYSFYCS